MSPHFMPGEKHLEITTLDPLYLNDLDNTMTFSPRLEKAFSLAVELHGNQTRKNSSIPYLAHLLAVTALVLENGGDEEQAAAALLHDAVEDQGGVKTLNRIREEFGERVARMVMDCTDAYTNPKPPWKARKTAYLESLAQKKPDSLLVSLADKVHNAQSILRDLKNQGESTWSKFNGGKEGTLWYYQSLARQFQNAPYPNLLDQLNQLVSQINELAGPGESLHD